MITEFLPVIANCAQIMWTSAPVWDPVSGGSQLQFWKSCPL
jgi:hypothetical protein